MAKRPFMSGYRTYNPDVEGYGDARSWREAFTATMGLDEARDTLGSRSPEAILGVGPAVTALELLRAYRAASMACHPDRCAVHGLTVEAATERFKQVTAAYTVLKARHGKK
jgi:DnaJ-domain-containing protein 1